MAFYQKYRAKNFQEMVGQAHVVGTLLASIKSDRLVHAYLLTGPRGIGKTSTARLLAKAINCEKTSKDLLDGKEVTGEPCNECETCKAIAEGRSVDVIEIDAASHTGVDDVRDLIEKSRLMPTSAKKKVYIIDEVHMLSKSAFNALLKTLEEPPSHVVFIMATTEVHKIPATILSRAQRYDFKRAEKVDLLENLRRVCKSEKIDVDDESLDLIAVAAAGGHRDALSLLEQVASNNEGKVTVDITRQILGITDTVLVYRFVGAIFNNFPEEGLKIAHELYEAGHDLGEFNKSVIEVLRHIMVYKLIGQKSDDESVADQENIETLSKLKSKTELIIFLNIFIESGNLLKDVTLPILPIEMAVVRCTNLELPTKNPVAAPEVQPKVVVSPVSKPVVAPAPKADLPKEEPVKEKPKPVEVHEDNMVPVPVVDMTKDIWEQIVDKVKVSNSTLAALLRDAKPYSMTDNVMTLGVKFAFHKDKISETKNAQILEEIVCEVTGSKYTVACKLVDTKVKPKAEVNPSEIEKAVEEIFEV
jgi:DNA polymerase-3 subunit gamma/tau